ncbi:unnamed protein product, partial [Thelazia callipaeda]|uniref:Secreted protein n=1 Tax=Thelazia callipaeda TaxID=103827 RepID=A0A0N5CUK8_THECL
VNINFAAIDLSANCDQESDHIKLGRCLRPWLDLWEMIRVQESHASNFLFPIPFYSRESVLYLCSAYLDSRSTCMTPKVLNRCKQNEMIAFIQSHMQYYCGNKAKIAFTKFECLRDALISASKCWPHLEGVPLPSYQAGKCEVMSKFFNCVLPTVEEKCKSSAVYTLVDAISSFGCIIRNELVKQSAKYVEKVNSTGQLTDKFGQKYIRDELSAVLPALDEEKHGQ